MRETKEETEGKEEGRKRKERGTVGDGGEEARLGLTRELRLLQRR